jgi:hypothetical protein
LKKENMSRSRNTEKESVRAKYRIARDEDGDVQLPRIIVRRPACGDIHPLPRNILVGALRFDVPIEYIYGLKRIELRARQGKHVGRYFAAYRRDEKGIILYSLPLQWTIETMPKNRKRELESWGVKIFRKDNKWQVHWPSEIELCMWYFTEVFTHELGHHFAEQYKKKRGKIGSRKFRELNANLHSLRLTRDIFKRMRKRSAEQKAKKT